MNAPTLARAIRAVMLTPEPRDKVMAARDVVRRWRGGELAMVFDVAMPDYPARPDTPELLPPSAMPKRGRGSAHGRLALLHALAHIEFVAIDLALDAAGRRRLAVSRSGRSDAFCADFPPLAHAGQLLWSDAGA